MINVPKWLFIFLCIAAALLLLAVIGIVFDVVTSITCDDSKEDKWHDD